MNFVKLISPITVLMVSFTMQTIADIGIGQQRLIDKNKINQQDEFTIECDINKFNRSLVQNLPNIVVMKVERKLVSEENFTSLAEYSPFVTELTKTQKYVPRGRDWEMEFNGAGTTGNRDSVRIKVHIKDASCADIGLYRCSMDISSFTKNEHISTRPFNLQNTDTIQHGYITMIPTSGHGIFHSKNKVGDTIVLSCTLTGPEDLTVKWSYATQNVPGRDIVYTTLEDITNYPPESALDCNACRTYFYMSTLKFKMTTQAHGNTYYCIASDNFSLTSRANFTIYVE